MRIGVVGNGAVGGYLAAALAAAGAEVVILSRGPGVIAEALALDGSALRAKVPIHITTKPSDLSRSELCLVAVKAQHTASVADALALSLAPETPVVSLQNGLHNVAQLRARLGARVLGGVITFSVRRDGGRVAKTSAGKLLVAEASGRTGRRLRALADLLDRVGETLRFHSHIEDAIAGKLLLNLNNGVCAALGMTLREALDDRDARCCFALCVEEGLEIMHEQGIEPASVSAVPAALLPQVLRLPTPVVRWSSVPLTKMHSDAMASTLTDLERGRSTEIDELNGAIVTLAQEHGRQAPRNQLVTGLVHDLEAAALAGAPVQRMRPATLRARLDTAGVS